MNRTTTKQIATIVIEDEKYPRDLLCGMIHKFCPELTIVSTAKSVYGACKEITIHTPKLVFLDVRLSDGKGFEILEKLAPINFQVIITTAYDSYAIKAIKYACIDYLLKPIAPDELIKAVKRALQNQPIGNTQENHINVFLKTYNPENPTERIGVPAKSGIVFLQLNAIVYCEAQGAYSKLYLTNNKTLLVSRNLKQLEKQMDADFFRRAHRAYLVNTNYVKELKRGETDQIILPNNQALPVSRRLKTNFMKGLS